MKKLLLALTIVGGFLLAGCNHQPAPMGCKMDKKVQGCKRSHDMHSHHKPMVNGCKSGYGMKHGKMEKNFRSVPMQDGQMLQTGEDKYSCPKCGMKLPMFYKTNHAAVVKGEQRQYCSANCAHRDALENGDDLKDMKVVDTKSLKFIDAQSAYFVVGSKKPATMSRVSKYAFSSKEDAMMFAKRNGGEVMNYQETTKVVRDSFK